MKEFEPSADFVTRVMRNVVACDTARLNKDAAARPLERFCLSRPFRYMVSCYGVLAGVLFIPATCL